MGSAEHSYLRGQAETLFADGLSCLSRGELPAAEAFFQNAIRLSPNFPEALANLGYVLDKRGEPGRAEESYRRALALQPTHSGTLLNLGAMLAHQYRYHEAEALYRLALYLEPDDPTLLSNLGALLTCLRRETEAEVCFRLALKAASDHRSSRFNLAYLLLRQGRLTEGWSCLESREWYAGFERSLNCPRWQGEALTGKALLIVCEAGQGDMIQFCRYAAQLKEQGASRVDVLCHPSLKRLFQTLTGADDIFALGDSPPDYKWDFWTPPLSLPHFLGTTLDTIPARTPYLQAIAPDVEYWQERLPQEGLRIGLVWKGNPKFENDAQRSIPNIKELAPLWSLPGLRFVSLQKGPGETESSVLADDYPITTVGPELRDFSDTAAVIAGLDLVISVDTAVAHLAGALDKPCWLLLPDHMTDWRWLNEREDSPWYPGTMRLFRQKQKEGWRPVIERVSDALSIWRDSQT